MTNPLFDSNATPTDPVEVDAEKAKAELIGEGKKYKTEADAIKALYHAQQHIPRLEQENREARAALNERKNAEDLLALLEAKLKAPSELPPVANQQVTPNNMNNDNPPKTETLTKEDISRLLDERLNSTQKQTKEESNLNSVIKTLEENWGPAFKNDLKAKATAMGVSEDYLLGLAKTNPQVFLSAVGGNVKRSSPTDNLPPRTSQNRGSFGSDNNTTRNQSFYSKMRRENPKLYWSANIQTQMHNDALSLKEKFYS